MGLYNESESIGHKGCMGVNVSEDSEPCDNNFVYIGEAFIQPTLLAIGILTNCASLVILPGSRIASTFKICLIALSISDLCATVTGFTQMLVEVIAYGGNIPFGYWESAAVASFTLYFLFMLFMCASAGIVILIVVIRSVIVSRPVKARRFLTRRRTRLLCWAVFIVTVLIYSPTTLNIFWQACYRDCGVNGTAFCIELFENIPNLETLSNAYLYTLSVIYGPVLVLVYIGCFIGIKVSLKKTAQMLEDLTERKNSIAPGGAQSSKKQLSKTARITRTLLVILLLDTFCTLPQVIQGIGLITAPTSTIFNNDTCWYDIFDVFVEICLCLRPTYNFWLYCYSHKEFRNRLRYKMRRVQFFCCRRCCQLDQRPKEQHSSSDCGQTGWRSSSTTASRCSNAFNSETESVASRVQARTKTKKPPNFKREGSWTRLMLLKASFKGRADRREHDHGSNSGQAGMDSDKSAEVGMYTACKVINKNSAV